MDIGKLRNLTHKVCNYRLENNLTYSEFCEKVNITNDELVALQVGNYRAVPDDVIERVYGVVYG